MAKQKVTPFLWFDDCAEEAAKFYTSLFDNSRVTQVKRRPGDASGVGPAMIVEFELGGVGYIALNGGPHFRLNEAFSLSVDCETQAEVDDLWERLASGGETSRCGWLKDRFGLSWQIVPSALGRLLGGDDPVRSKRVMDALMTMTKIDIQQLQDAYDNE